MFAGSALAIVLALSSGCAVDCWCAGFVSISEMGFECFASGLDSVGSSCLRSWTSAMAVPYLWPLATVTVLGIGSAPRRYSCHSRHGSRC